MRIFAPSQQVSAKNLPSHTKLKFRQEGQGAPLELTASRDLRAELLDKERKHFLKTRPTNFDEEREEDLRLLSAAPPAGAPDEDGGGGHAARPLVPRAADADEEDEDEGSSDESDEDDEVWRHC